MRVSELTREKRVHATVDLGDGDTIELAFDRNRVTPAWVAVAQKRDEEKDSYSLPKALADVILEWDVFQEVAGDFPPTPENIGVLSYPAQSDLMVRIIEAATPSRAEGNASSAPSSTVPSVSTEQPPTPQNGQVTLPSPAPSASLSPT